MGTGVRNGAHSAWWLDKLSSYLNKEVTVRFGKLKMQLWDSMCWPHVNPVPSGAVGKDCQRRLLSGQGSSEPVAPRIYFIYFFLWRGDWVTNVNVNSCFIMFSLHLHLHLVKADSLKIRNFKSVWQFCCSAAVMEGWWVRIPECAVFCCAK
jgi:hypothetical protein